MMKLSKRLALNYIRAKFKLLSAISKKKAAEKAFELFITPQTKDRHEWKGIFADAEILRFKLFDHQITGYRWNKGGNRRVLILHGFESAATNFEKYIDPLICKGYEVLAFDAPAHGHSSGTQITALLYRDLIKYAHENYGPILSYMGHSLGGFALSLALAELPHDENFRAVFIAPSSETTTAIDNSFLLLQLDADVRREFENIITQMSGRPVSWFSINRTMSDIRARILWIHDEGDTITPLRDAMKIKEANYPNIEFVITFGLGHSRIYRDEEVRRRVVEFL
ncbi:MAG: alpha/beta hydrolase [Chitinophagaceae bacterium]|nr:alpha/beta hydrolase [Chitinophagaceae bacterium]